MQLCLRFSRKIQQNCLVLDAPIRLVGAKYTCYSLNEDLEIAYLQNAQMVKSALQGFGILILHFSEYNRFYSKF